MLVIARAVALDLPDILQGGQDIVEGVEEVVKDIQETASEVIHAGTVEEPDVVMPKIKDIKRMGEAEKDQRLHWFISAFILIFLAIVGCGTGILVLGPLLKSQYLPLVQVEPISDTENAETENDQGLTLRFQRDLVILMFSLTAMGSLAACLWSMMNDHLSRTIGMDWELYLMLFSGLGLSLLIQAVFAVRWLKPGQEFKASTFLEAAILAMMPLLSDFYDTLKDFKVQKTCLWNIW